MGAGNYDTRYYQLRRNPQYVIVLHSLELQMAAELGVGGVLAVLLFCGGILSACWTRRGTLASGDALVKVAAAGMFAAWLVDTSVDWTYDIPGLAGRPSSRPRSSWSPRALRGRRGGARAARALFEVIDFVAAHPGPLGYLRVAAPSALLAAGRLAMRRVSELVEVASLLNLRGLRIRELMSYYEHEFKKIPLAELSPAWFLFDIAPIHRRRTYRSLRRATDVALAALLLLCSLPLLLLAAAAIRLTSSGPALYRQRRVGKAGEEFVLLELRTMVPPAAGDADAPAACGAAHAHRVTPVGRLLRRFRRDELPHYSSRHRIRPGVTGWTQVNLGYGGSVEGTVAKLQRDLYYIKHHSLRLDALIVWVTDKAVLAGRGCN